jgi:hypothetical protein
MGIDKQIPLNEEWRENNGMRNMKRKTERENIRKTEVNKL